MSLAECHLGSFYYHVPLVEQWYTISPLVMCYTTWRGSNPVLVGYSHKCCTGSISSFVDERVCSWVDVFSFGNVQSTFTKNTSL